MSWRERMDIARREAAYSTDVAAEIRLLKQRLLNHIRKHIVVKRTLDREFIYELFHKAMMDIDSDYMVPNVTVTVDPEDPTKAIAEFVVPPYWIVVD